MWIRCSRITSARSRKSSGALVWTSPKLGKSRANPTMLVSSLSIWGLFQYTPRAEALLQSSHLAAVQCSSKCSDRTRLVEVGFFVNLLRFREVYDLWVSTDVGGLYYVERPVMLVYWFESLGCRNDSIIN